MLGIREFEQQRELRERGLQVGPDQNGPTQASSGKVSVSEEIVYSHMDKVQSFVSFGFLDITMCCIVVKVLQFCFIVLY